MEKLYQAHQPNLKYEKDFLIFIDPTDPNKYIPLMLATKLGADGVSISSLPSSLLFYDLSSKKHKIDHEKSSSKIVGQLLVNLLTSENQVPSPSDGSQSSDYEVGTTTMIDYLKFTNILPSQHEENITQELMIQWGLIDGIIAQLIDNVLKYKKRLHHPKF
ncbi:hypothetical protein VP01_218g7 [Puccinia sorghi]|uniref:Uncharacterized protein n=1 Tax=Puccinia sorghi TaxID=27349 RepID=A0A0L6V9B4_9BASI|nr:hypothetical protein VP01_218g7 [Puccinia sorghi]